MKKPIKIFCSIALIWIFFLIGKSFLYSFDFLQKPAIKGYVNNVYVAFPFDQYTFSVAVDKTGMKPVITDNLWGFRYPSMQPLVPDLRKQFLVAFEHTDWVKVSVHPWINSLNIDQNSCLDHAISASLSPGGGGLLSQISTTDSFVEKSDVYFGGLKKMSVPNKEEYKDRNKYSGPSDIYWDSQSGHACVQIVCKNYSKDYGQYCTHTVIDTKNKLVFSFDYDSSILPGWNDVQAKVLNIFYSFSSKSDN